MNCRIIGSGMYNYQQDDYTGSQLFGLMIDALHDQLNTLLSWIYRE